MTPDREQPYYWVDRSKREMPRPWPGRNAFWVRVNSKGLEPEIPAGAFVIVDPDTPPEVGSVVMTRLHFDDSSEDICLLARFKGGGGRDLQGRFCKRGDPQERFIVGGLAYSRIEVDQGFVRIEGAVTGVQQRF